MWQLGPRPRTWADNLKSFATFDGLAQKILTGIFQACTPSKYDSRSYVFWVSVHDEYLRYFLRMDIFLSEVEACKPSSP
jgi:hypothetical protein